MHAHNVGSRLTHLGFVLLLGYAPCLAQQNFGEFTDQTDVPDTPAARRANEVIEAVNTLDATKLREFVSQNFSPELLREVPLEEHIQILTDVRSMNGGFEIYGVRTYTNPPPGQDLVLVLKGRSTGLWRGLMIRVDPQPAHKIAGLRFTRARPPQGSGSENLTDADLINELNSHVERLVAADRFSGAVLLARDGKPLWIQAYGEADKSWKASNRVDTKFNLGSMNKMFTAIAAAQLAEQGRLAFEDPVSKYLGDDWLPREVAEKITVAQLLSHTSGLGSYFNDTFFGASRERYRTVDDYKLLVKDERPAFEPGSAWAYSNTGFLLAGAIIEKITGTTYYDYVREYVFKPAGMNQTDSYEMDKVNSNLALGYSRVEGPSGSYYESNILKHVVKGGPAGGGYSTVEDLLRFDQALRPGTLVSNAMTERMWTATPQSTNSRIGRYGMGFGLEQDGTGRSVGHSGGFPGISANFRMYLDTGYTLIVLSNYDYGAELVSERASELLSQVKR